VAVAAAVAVVAAGAAAAGADPRGRYAMHPYTKTKVTTIMNSVASLRARLRHASLALLLALPMTAAAADQRSFPTPEAAVDALAGALKANDEAALVELFGAKYKHLLSTGSPADDAGRRAQASAWIAAFRALEESGPDRRVLLVGEKAWPFPIPIVREGNAWRFATERGVDEILNRRVGRNERNALYVLQQYVDAQRRYASRDRDGDGVLQYAARLGSSPGKFDGLYWPAGRNEEQSPFGPLIAESATHLAGHTKGDAYHGYHFRILTRQGPGAAGGAYNYVINGRMVAGFAMVAYPAQYGESGVMTFIVNQNGTIFEKDLGPGTAATAQKMTAFDPGPAWKATQP
jgi:hypothetical protein